MVQNVDQIQAALWARFHAVFHRSTGFFRDKLEITAKVASQP